MRRKFDFHVQVCNKSIFKKSVIIMKIKLYNKVTNRIKKIESFSFYSRIKIFSTGTFFLCIE